MTKVMKEHGVDIGRINYQDNSNWSLLTPEGPHFKYHLYGRATTATIQKYGEALYGKRFEEDPEFYKGFKALTEVDVQEIGKEIEMLLKTEEFSDGVWGIK